MIRQYSRCCKSEKKKKKRAAGSRIQNMLGSTNWEEGSTDQEAFLHNLILAQQSIKSH